MCVRVSGFPLGKVVSEKKFSRAHARGGKGSRHAARGWARGARLLHAIAALKSPGGFSQRSPSVRLLSAQAWGLLGISTAGACASKHGVCLVFASRDSPLAGAYMLSRRRLHAPTRAYTRLHAPTCTSMCLHMHLHAPTCTYMRLHASTCAYMHLHTLDAPSMHPRCTLDAPLVVP